MNKSDHSSHQDHHMHSHAVHSRSLAAFPDQSDDDKSEELKMQESQDESEIGSDKRLFANPRHNAHHAE